jgi:hypothetical protein
MSRFRPAAYTVIALVPLLVACGSDSTGPEDVLPVTLVAADRIGDIYTINETTGVETLIIPTTTQNSTGTMVSVGVVSSMLYVESTQLWWLGTGGNAECDGCIQTLNPTTGVATTLRSTVADRGVSGLAAHPTTGAIYTWESDSTNRLYGLDATTAVVDSLFTGLGIPSGGTGTTFSADGTLYVVGGDELWTIDLVTGVDTYIGTTTFVGFPAFVGGNQSIGSMTTRPSDGQVFGILKDGGGISNIQVTYLVTVDLTTAAITNVGSQTELMDGLAFVPTTLLP